MVLKYTKSFPISLLLAFCCACFPASLLLTWPRGWSPPSAPAHPRTWLSWTGANPYYLLASDAEEGLPSSFHSAKEVLLALEGSWLFLSFVGDLVGNLGHDTAATGTGDGCVSAPACLCELSLHPPPSLFPKCH